MNIAQKAFHALFSPPRSIPKSDNEDHNKSSANPRSAHTSPRCQFTFSDGRQCRSQRASLCIHHARRRRTPGDEVAPDAGLEALCGDLTTATNINRALTQVFLLMAQGRIPQKQAGYLSQLLLQTVPGIRSEFVSAFGYRQWEAKLKISLAPNSNEDPGPSGGSHDADADGTGQPITGVVEPKKAVPSRESHGDQELSRVNKVTAFFRQKEVTEPDYDSLYSRSLDLLDRKYDTTPEGRSEAKKLALELELMKPPASKPPKGYFGEVVDLVRRLRAHQQRKPAVAVNASRPSPAPAAANAPIVPAPPAACSEPLRPPTVPSAPAAASPICLRRPSRAPNPLPRAQ